MKIGFACDHAAVDLKNTLLEYLKGKGADIIFQTIPEDTPMKLDDILKRYK